MSYRTFDMVSTDAQTALTEYLADYETALAAAPIPWARQYGAYRSSRALRTRWPIPLTTALYKEFNGDPRYRSLAHKTVELIKKIWQDGVAELRSVVEAPDFFGWGTEPQNMAAAAVAHPNAIIRDLLATGTSDLAFDGQAFFSNAHPFNVMDTSLGTFDNLHTSQTVNATNLAAAKVRFRQIKSASGESLGLRCTHILSPANLEESWLDVLSTNYQGGAPAAEANANRHRGSVTLIVADELPDNVWYPMALNKAGIDPWALCEGMREDTILGTDSALYETKGKIGFSSKIEMNGTLLFPHAIQRCAV